MNHRLWFIFLLALAQPALALNPLCKIFLQWLGPKKNLIYDDEEFEKSGRFVSPEYLERVNQRTEAFLKSHGVEFREIQASEAFNIPSLEINLNTKGPYPLLGKVKMYQILGVLQPKHRKLTGLAFSHKDFNATLQELHHRGIAVLVDPSIDWFGAAGTHSYGGSEIRLAPDANWSTLVHEKAHADFLRDVIERMLREGYFDEIKARYDKDIDAFRIPELSNETLPLLAYLQSPSGISDIEYLKAHAFINFAYEMPEDEYRALLKENSVVAHVVTLVRKGDFTNSLTLNEGAATSVQLKLHERLFSLPWDVNRVHAERYQIRYQLEELRARIEINPKSVTDLAKIKELERHDFLLSLLQKIPHDAQAWASFVKSALHYGAPISLPLTLTSSTVEEDRKEDEKKRREKSVTERRLSPESAKR